MAKYFVLYTPIGVVYKNVFYGDELSTSKRGEGAFEQEISFMLEVTAK